MSDQTCTCLSISRDPLCVFHGDIDKVRPPAVPAGTGETPENVLSAPMASALLLTLKAECEAQHARAEAAEAALLALREGCQQTIEQWRAQQAVAQRLADTAPSESHQACAIAARDQIQTCAEELHALLAAPQDPKGDQT